MYRRAPVAKDSISAVSIIHRLGAPYLPLFLIWIAKKKILLRGGSKKEPYTTLGGGGALRNLFPMNTRTCLHLIFILPSTVAGASEVEQEDPRLKSQIKNGKRLGGRA